jgi:UDP-2,3-diacylglucosamine hydrolase
MNAADKSTLFLSDLHLPRGDSSLREMFIHFCAGPARDAGEVFILGDLFEFWVGDDVGMGDYAAEIAALQALTQSGVRVSLMHGNRDFMVGRQFCKRAGVRLLKDPHEMNLFGIPTVLSHGDIYCTDDEAYQRWRRFSRKPLAQWFYLRLPVSRRERIAGNLRQQSGMRSADTIMDVNDQAIRAAFREQGMTRLIHGHTHRPEEHQYEIAGRTCERLVLADWRPERMEYVEANATGLRRILLS